MVRHFYSNELGSGFATLARADLGAGTICIAAQRPSAKMYTFLFSFDAPQARSLADRCKDEATVRIAIAHAEIISRNGSAVDGAPLMLNLGVVPFSSTFTREYRLSQMHACKPEERERRVDLAKAHLIDRAVHLLALCGPDLAAQFLYKRAVPEYIVLRVMSSAAFRRKALPKFPGARVPDVNRGLEEISATQGFSNYWY